MATWKVKVKEKNNAHVLTPEYIDGNDTMMRADIVAFFGLENDDVEWYEIEKTH